jgi:acid stress-induced BolA-like protein IbaG/YrbA
MQIVAIEPLDDCINSGLSYEIHFDCPLTREAIKLLAEFGKLESPQTSSRPIFRFQIENRIHVKGVENSTSCAVIVDRTDVDGSIARVRQVFETLASYVSQRHAPAASLQRHTKTEAPVA